MGRGAKRTRKQEQALQIGGKAMKRTALTLLFAAVFAGGLVASFPNTAQAGHKRHVGVYVGSGGFSVGVGYPVRHHGYFAPYRHTVITPYVVPTCCHYEKVYVPGHWDAYGWHPGYFQKYRVCDHHGRVLAY
jgi:hypothetical protein